MNREERIQKLEQKLAEDLGLYLVDGVWNCDGDVNLKNMNLFRLPLKFGIVKGSFDCLYNRFVNLNGAPTMVGGNFDCANN